MVHHASLNYKIGEIFMCSSYLQLIDENRWYHFDDSHVSLVSESEIKTSAAYVLFYRRVKNGLNTGEGEASETHMAS